MQKKKVSLKSIQIMHVFLCLGVVFVGIFLGDFSAEEWRLEAGNNNELMLIVGLPVVAMVIGQVIFNKQIEDANTLESFEEQLQAYQSAHIIRIALLEGVAMFIAVYTQFSGELVPLMMFLILIGRMGFLFPTKARIEKELKLR